MAQSHVSLSARRSIPSPRSTSWLIVQRIIVAAFLFAPAMRGVAQAAVTAAASATPPEGSNWQHVQALPLGTSIHVKAQHKSATCAFKSADADSLTCLNGSNLTFQRTEVKSITIPRRGASTAVMAGVGAGVGVATVKIVSETIFGDFYNKNGGAKGAVWAGGAGAGAAVFGLIGYATHPVHSTIYKKP